MIPFRFGDWHGTDRPRAAEVRGGLDSGAGALAGRGDCVRGRRVEFSDAAIATRLGATRESIQLSL